jgi:tellurite resistance protein
MHEQDKAILQGLVSMAWADGNFADRERELLDALLESFGATADEANEMREYAKTKRGVDDIALTELSFGDRRNLLNHAVALSWVDGEQHPEEIAFLKQLCAKMNISEAEAKEIEAVATARAQELLKLLDE